MKRLEELLFKACLVIRSNFVKLFLKMRMELDLEKKFTYQKLTQKQQIYAVTSG